ncbi:PA2778 family cysteine peptidase [Thalassotalea insulae]|nr:PA2778 family cysteine peptidase [Thalassotalea insulae]
MKKAGLVAGLFIVMAGCQTPPHTQKVLANPPKVMQHKIAQVPFYAQQAYYCGPTTLSEVANFYGVTKTPEEIAPNTFVPELKGSLTIEMTAATRQLGMLAYTQYADLSQLLSLIAQDIPVIVLQNNSIELFPQWHYAVVIGYDIHAKEVILHTGLTENYRLDLSTFERTWKRGKYWMLAMLPPDKANKNLDPFIYTKASQALLDTGQAQAGIKALKSAVKQWPEHWLAYFLLANYQLKNSVHNALVWYAKGVQYAKQQAQYLNNYAYALGKANCYHEAVKMIDVALTLKPGEENILDTKAQLTRWQRNAVFIQQCPSHDVF